MTHWIDVAAEADLFEGAGIAVAPEGQDIAVFKLEDGGVHAINNLCSHGNAKLCDGFVEGHQVECPFHQALFDVRDGTVSCGPATEPVKSWPVKIEGGRVFLNLQT
ncbi:non-heme iron oxygenase ferredoxin subunit [Limnohabitans lacus]|jgi:naphthalene 1,2-dioxygenase ferredoxin component|uniref:Non-heme iron oxygenase ferredoxin subunit n=1 Tax=Limnohabitans lacus TaxID=3045173 RepID=A0ABT6X7G0_9BURK|nr:non-heme iron oxygenase ferredoxin subunit [Limnohabitans sp. HM2-2]MDI9234050.1 non-heme iron oxygenase ferredoxin subunit [Limnohabitans sp. HM2-2]